MHKGLVLELIIIIQVRPFQEFVMIGSILQRCPHFSELVFANG